VSPPGAGSDKTDDPCGTYGSPREVISQAKSFTFTDARASSRCCSWHRQLADPELLKQFLATVPPPMPRLYPGLLTDNDVELFAEFLKTTVFNCGPNEPQSCAPPGKPAGHKRGKRSVLI
jgi:hypothetical protein